MPRADDLVRLARLDATVTEDQIAVHTRHDNHGTPTVWKRSLRPIGQGGFGAVYREECIEGRNRGSLRAVKAVQKVISQGSPQMDYSKELEAIARFSQLQYQQHFVRSFGWYENASTIFIAMEFVEHGDLQQYVGRAMPEPEMQLIVSQVLEGLSHMHNLSYAHRDLKPANLLVYRKGPQWHVKIADFGLSKRLTESLSSLHTRAGTHGFMAPEILGLLHDDDEDSDTESGPSYTNAVDVWALGVITFQLLTTQLPFAAGDFRPLRKYVKGKAPFTQEHLVASRISFSGIAWIESCLAPSPAQRPSAGFSRKHRWPIGALITESAHPLPRTVDSESLASASWSVQDSGYETASRHLSTTPPQQLGQSMRANAQLSDGSSVFDGEHDAHPWVEVTNMEIERAERPIFSQHGHLAVLSDSLLHIWDATGAWKSKKLADLPGYHSPYESGTAGNPPHSCNIESFSPDGRHIAICTGSGTIVWNTVTWESVKMFNETLNGNGASLFVRFSSDGRLLVSGDEDHKVDEKSLVVKLWDTASWTVVKQLRVKQLGRSIYFIRVCATSRDGLMLGLLPYSRSGSPLDSTVILNLATDTEVPLLTLGSGMRGMAISPDKRHLVSVHDHGQAILWDSSTGCELRQMAVHHSGPCLLNAVFSPDGRQIACGTRVCDSGIVVWVYDTATGEIRDTIRHNANSSTVDCADVIISPDGQSIALWQRTLGSRVNILKRMGRRRD